MISKLRRGRENSDGLSVSHLLLISIEAAVVQSPEQLTFCIHHPSITCADLISDDLSSSILLPNLNNNSSRTLRMILLVSEAFPFRMSAIVKSFSDRKAAARLIGSTRLGSSSDSRN